MMLSIFKCAYWSWIFFGGMFIQVLCHQLEAFECCRVLLDATLNYFLWNFRNDSAYPCLLRYLMLMHLCLHGKNKKQKNPPIHLATIKVLLQQVHKHHSSANCQPSMWNKLFFLKRLVRPWCMVFEDLDDS